MTCYKPNYSKLRKIGEEGYEKGQEQAKEYFAEIPLNSSCHINITEKNITREICDMSGIRPPIDNRLLIVIHKEEEKEEHFGLSIYFLDSEGKAANITISYESFPRSSDYELAEKIFNFILSKWEG